MKNLARNEAIAERGEVQVLLREILENPNLLAAIVLHKIMRVEKQQLLLARKLHKHLLHLREVFDRLRAALLRNCGRREQQNRRLRRDFAHKGDERAQVIGDLFGRFLGDDVVRAIA